MFHLEQAAACGDLTALITMAEVYLQLPHDVLASAAVQVMTSYILCSRGILAVTVNDVINVQGPFVRNPVNTNLGLKFNQGFCFSYVKRVFTANSK